MSKSYYQYVLVLALGILSTSALAGPAGLDALWTFDEGSGTVAGDSSGNGHDGTLVGELGWGEGLFGMALQCPGTNGDRVVMDGYAGITGNNERTAVAWVKSTEPGDFFTWGSNTNGAKWMIRLDFQGAGGGLRTEASGGYVRATTDLRDDEWHHVASVFKGSSMLDVKHYVDGKLEDVDASKDVAIDTASGTVWIGDGLHDRPYTGLIDEAAIFNRALTAAEIEDVMQGLATVSGLASKPEPADKASDVLRDGVELRWEAGPFAQSHDVYYGRDFDDVNDATLADPLGATVEAGLTAPMLALGRLDFDATYYWRVDEVNAPSSPGVYKGSVWSFTVEPKALVVSGVTATASSKFNDTEVAEKTVDGSGLADGVHDLNRDNMWLSDGASLTGNWIAYDLGQVQVLSHMQVWNHNTDSENILGYGVKEALIETSADGNTWESLKTVEIAQATKVDYQGVEVALDGVTTQFIRISPQSNWSGLGLLNVGLAEVRFYAIPVAAREPNPADQSSDNSAQVTLAWRAGRQAAQHEVHLGTDPNALTLFDTVDVSNFEVALDLGQTYYWQINEVNTVETPSVHSGPVWSFSTEAYVTIDNFEGYTDDWGNVIFQFWIDGLGWEDADGNSADGNGSGAIVGYWPPPTIEKSVAYDGSQSMPLTYGDGDLSPSKAVRTFAKPLVANQYGIQSLSLQFYGGADNVGGQLFVEINGQKVADYPGPQSDLLEAQWHAWPIDLAGAGITTIQSLAVGVTGGKGLLFIDAIRMYPLAGETVTPVVPHATGLVAHYAFEGDATDATGAHPGTATNDPAYAEGKQGQALNVTSDQYIMVPYAETLALNTFSVSAWVKIADGAGIRGILGTRFNGNHTFDLKVNQGLVHGDIGDGSSWLNTKLDIKAEVGAGNWQHIVYVIDDESDTASLYLNGLLGGQVTFDGTPLFMSSGQELRIGVSYGTEFMNGLIDEVKIYNRTLSAAEVAGMSGREGLIYQPF